MLGEIHARDGAVRHKCARPAPSTTGWLKLTQEPQTGIRTTAEEQPRSSLTGSGTELHPLLNTMPNLTPSLTTSTWSSDSISERARGGGITSMNGLGQGPPMASSRGLGTRSLEANAISVDDGLGQGLPMASSRGASNLNFNVENVCSNVVGQGPPMASSRGPGNIYLEQVGVNSLGRGTVHGVNYGSSNITLSNPSSNANGVGHGLAAYTTTGPGGASIQGGLLGDQEGTHSQPGGAGVLAGLGVTDANTSDDTLGGQHMFGGLGNGTGSANHSHSYTRGQGVASSLTNPMFPGLVNHSLTEAFGVPERVKKMAWQGKDVPLYMFLPGFGEHDNSDPPVLATVPGKGGHFTLTASNNEKEKALSRRPLSPAEFASAFLRYKGVILQRFPESSAELDAYLAHILAMASGYTGHACWQYHLLFSRKAANLWEQGVHTNWASADPMLLHASIASHWANICEHCQSLLHATTSCPFNPQGGWSAPQGRVFSNPPFGFGNDANSDNVPICNNFNDNGCKQTVCNYLHICRLCRGPDHPAPVCKGKASSA